MLTNGVTGRLDHDAAQLRLRLGELSRQLGSGFRADTPSGLAPELPRATALRTEVARRTAYEDGIREAQHRAAATQPVLERMIVIGREFAEQVALKLDADHPEALPAIAERARQALLEVGHLLNTKLAGDYLFGGSDLATPPVIDPDGLPNSGWAAQIGTAIAGLGGGNASAIATFTRATVQDDSTGMTPFSDFVSDPGRGLSEPRRSVATEDGVLLPFGVFANRNAAATSTGETAGGWARDLMRGLMSLAALTPAQVADRQDFFELGVTIREGLRSATEALGAEAGALGQAEARLAAARTRHDEVSIAIREQLAAIEEVDLAETLTRLQQTETQLQASYGAIARLSELSLVRFL
jgi:flagellin-like hook-associated protein FlgL